MKFGEVRNGTYYTIRKPETFFIKYQGFGISESVLKELEEKGVKWIVIKYIGAKGILCYSATLKQYLRSPTCFTFGEKDKQKIVSKYDLEVI